MKVVGVIPARYASSRFPGKPLVKILGKEMILHVAEKLALAIGKEQTYIATDDERIKKVAEEAGYEVVMTSEDCLTGTDRIWEFAQKVKADIYINVQGDEPMVHPQDIQKIVQTKIDYFDFVINGMCRLSDDEDPFNVNIPKVLVNRNSELIYMSRLPIPGSKDQKVSGKEFWKQVCIYAFSFEEIKTFGQAGEKSVFEKFEDIEILRFFDFNVRVKMVEVNGNTIAVDVPEDVSKVESIL